MKEKSTRTNRVKGYIINSLEDSKDQKNIILFTNKWTTNDAKGYFK